MGFDRSNTVLVQKHGCFKTKSKIKKNIFKTSENKWQIHIVYCGRFASYKYFVVFTGCSERIRCSSLPVFTYGKCGVRALAKEHKL